MRGEDERSKQTRFKAEWIILHGLKGPLYRCFRAWKTGSLETRAVADPTVGGGGREEEEEGEEERVYSKTLSGNKTGSIIQSHGLDQIRLD